MNQTLDQKQLAAGESSTALARPRAAHSTSQPLHKRPDLRRWTCPADVADGCAKAAVEATLEAMEADPLDPGGALQAGCDAFRLGMPKLTSRQNARAYIACIDVGARGGWLTDKQIVDMVRLVTASIQSFARNVKGREVSQ